MIFIVHKATLCLPWVIKRGRQAGRLQQSGCDWWSLMDSTAIYWAEHTSSPSSHKQCNKCIFSFPILYLKTQPSLYIVHTFQWNRQWTRVRIESCKALRPVTLIQSFIFIAFLICPVNKLALKGKSVSKQSGNDSNGPLHRPKSPHTTPYHMQVWPLNTSSASQRLTRNTVKVCQQYWLHPAVW